MMEENKLTQQDPKNEQARQEALGVLRSSFEMYEKTRNDTIEARSSRTDKFGKPMYSQQSTDETLELMDTMQADIVQQYIQLGGDIKDLEEIRTKKNVIDRSHIAKAMAESDDKDKVKELVNNIRKKREKREKPLERDDSAEQKEEKFNVVWDSPSPEIPKKDEIQEYWDKTISTIPEPVKIEEKDASVYNENKPKVAYDTVALPSNGECYKNKVKEIKVSHLVAYDENLIMSPSLYRNGTFLDHILKNKILDNINPDDLIQGDRDAIIIWLRAGGYGNEYPIRMTDEKTGKEFETVVDLSELKFKKFTLKGDENGYFDFTLPVSKDVVKFRFLTNGDVKKLEKMRENENEAEKVTTIKNYIREIRSFLESSQKFNSDTFEELTSVEEEIYDKYKDVSETYYTHDLTNRLIMSTVSVNGVSDRKFITNYIANMNLKDASEYRKYIVENEPGIDYNIKVKRPESLGGGYVETFLQLDQFIFIY